MRPTAKVYRSVASPRVAALRSRETSENVSRCLFPENFADEVETRLWPLQSIYDPLQKGKDPQTHGEWLVNEINRTILAKPTNGGWIHSCERHCGAELLTIDGNQVPAAVQTFLHSPKRGHRTLWLQDNKYPCKDPNPLENH